MKTLSTSSRKKEPSVPFSVKKVNFSPDEGYPLVGCPELHLYIIRNKLCSAGRSPTRILVVRLGKRGRISTFWYFSRFLVKWHSAHKKFSKLPTSPKLAVWCYSAPIRQGCGNYL